MKKRLLSFLLAFAMVLPYLAVGIPAVSAESGVLTIGDLESPWADHTPDYTADVPDGFTVDDVSWYCYDPEEPGMRYMQETETFRDGVYYEVQIMLYNETGAYVNDAVVLGASSVTTGFGMDNMLLVRAGYLNGCQELPYLQLTNIPETIEVGQQIPFNFASNDSRYFLVAEWTDGQGNYLEEGEIFVLNENYELRLTAYPKEGYIFCEDSYIYKNVDVNGELVRTVDAFIRKEYTTKQLVRETFVESNQPTAGGVAADVSFTVPEDANYQINQVTWFLYSNETGLRSIMEDGATFLSGRIYEAEVEVTLKDEYAFDVSEMTLQYNGEQKQYASLDSNCFWFDVTFPVDTQVVDPVDITGVPLAVYAGGTPAKNITSPEPEKYQFIATWYDEDWEELPENATFQMGNTYSLYLEVLPLAGYSLAEDAGISITGGGDVLDRTYYYFTEAWGYIEVTYELYDIVSHVEVTGLSEPVVGQKLDFDVEIPADAAYEVYEVVWYRYNYDLGHNERLDENFVVTDGNFYSCMISLEPVGVRFSEALTVSLNGAAYEDASYTSYYVGLYPQYNLGVEVIDQVDLSNLPTTVAPGDVLNRIDVSLEPDKYSVEAYWTDSEMGELEDGAVAQIGHHYDLEFEILAKEGYAFSKDTVAKYDKNGSFDYDVCDFEEFYGRGYFGFNVYHRIDRVDLLNVQIPVAGQTATVSGITVPQDANYSLEQVYWADEWGDEFTGKFTTGSSYYLVAEFSFDQDNTELTNCAVYVNGKYAFAEADNWEYNVIHCQIKYNVTGKDIPLVEVNNLPVPRVGNYISNSNSIITIPSGANYTVSSVSWFKYLQQENRLEEVNGRYFGNYAYTLHITLAPKAGYRFNNPDVVLGGELHDGFGIEENGNLVVIKEYYLTTPISELHITGVKDPVVGQYASTSGITVAESSKLNLIKIWLAPDTEDYVNGYTGKFVAGGEYALVIAAQPKDGYHFAEDLKVYVNGQLDPEAISGAPHLAGIERYYNLGGQDSVVNRVDVTVDIPEVGKVVGPKVVELPQNAKYEVSWDYYTLDEGETYMDDQTYYIGFDLSPLDGYTFAEDAAIYVNGQLIDPKYVNTQNMYMIGISMNFYFGEEVSRVDLTDVPDAVLGEKPPRDNWMEGNSTMQYDVYCDWYIWNPNEGCWEYFNGTFEEGYYYRRALYISPQDGCYFADDVLVTVNGEAVPVILSEPGYMQDIYTYYNFGTDTKDTIELTGAGLPEIDAVADASGVKLVPGSGCALDMAAWYCSSKKDLTLDTWEPTDTFQSGKYHALMLAVRRKDDIPFDQNLTIIIDGVEYTDCFVYLYDEYAIVAVPFGKLYDGDGVPGDMNGDDEVDEADVEALLMYFLYPEEFPIEVDGDLNGDGEVDEADVEALLMYFLYPEEFPLN